MFVEPHRTNLRGNDFVGRKVQCTTLPFLSGDTIKRVVDGDKSCLTHRREVFVLDHNYPQGGVQETEIHSINFLVEVSEEEGYRMGDYNSDIVVIDYIDMLYFRPGEARWTSNFTPPTEPYQKEDSLEEEFFNRKPQ